MYLWRRQAGRKWWSDNEGELRAAAGNRLVTIEQVGRKRLELEVTSGSRSDAQKLAKQFGGRIEKLPSDWLRRFSRQQKNKPIKIRNQKLIIPAGAAFGTGEHATTAMSLRMLEKLTRKWKPGWSIVDLGTGSGILALAARSLGAKRVIGIDNDPLAISTAKQNARLNGIEGVTFRLGDVRHWNSRTKVDIITANLFSELLIKILPKLKAGRWMILSGILRDQERDVTRALRRHKIDIVQVRRRGKWVAILTAVR
jgi:ribosomal protein L11 methyltransferase